MNRNRNVQWTQIDTTSDDTGLELQLNLEAEPVEEDNVRQESQDTRRPLLTVSKNQENKNTQDRTEDEEDQVEAPVQNRQARQPEVNDEDTKRENRAHKRIQTLLAREREATQTLAQERAEKQELRRQLAIAQKNSAVTNRDAYKARLDRAEQEMTDALNANDAVKIAKLNRQIADDTMKLNAYEAVSEDIDIEPEVERPQNVQRPAETAPEAAKAWLKRNPKFMQDEVFHTTARILSQKLSNESELDPNDDDYWEELDKRIREKLKIDEPAPQTRQPQRRNSPVASRSDEDAESYTADVSKQFKRTGNTVSADPTASDRDTAERLGIKVGDLMKEKYKYAQQGFKGYVEIDIPGQPR